jgi:ATP-dependent Clp protease ATP-binding subunit ClpA
MNSVLISDLVDQTHSLIGRGKELDRRIELLCRFNRKNPVLVGEPGVGKRTIVGGLARRIADGNIPQALSEKIVLSLDLPPLQVLERDASSHERLDRALVAAAEDGKIFFVNRMHDRPGGVSPVASFHVTELLLRPIMAGKIQCIGTSRSLPPMKRPQSRCCKASKGLTKTSTMFLIRTKPMHMPFSAAVDIIDEVGAAAQLEQGSLSEQVVEVQKRIRFIASD